jgi:transcriptional regulator with XRE-family HTH domain
MQGIGERLEEARKRKGVSLREAAEATKIRSDFLSHFEHNKFDFSLPDIYKRGFIKNYARFLDMDAAKLLTDYDAYQLAHSRTQRKGGSEWFGHIDIKKQESPRETADGNEEAAPAQSSGHAPSAAPLGSMTRPARPKHDPRYEEDEAEDAEPETDKILYIKVGLVFVGTLALVFVIFGLVRAILGGGSEPAPAGPEFRDEATAKAPASTTAAAAEDSITLSASGNVYVIVKQLDDDEIVFRDTLAAGDTVAVDKSGPVDVLFTAGENLVIEHGGERLRPSSSGTAKVTLP